MPCDSAELAERGTGRRRPKYNNLAVTQVIDFEARAFGELSRAVEITFFTLRAFAYKDVRLHGCKW